MTMISVVIPTIRPEGRDRCIASVYENGGIPKEDIEIVTETDTERIGAPKMVNRLVAKASHDLILFLGDDTTVEKDCIRNALDCMASEGTEFVGLNDCHSGPKATHFIISKRLIALLPDGQVFNERYLHNADPELSFRIRMLGQYAWCETAKITHHHPFWGAAPTDDDYRRVLSRDVCDHDHKLFLERCVDDRPLLGFCGIFKDEADNIEALIASVKPYVDYWCILDTGSTDGTQDLIRKAFEGVPGELHDGVFTDFSTTRNEALRLLGTKTRFSLMLSGHETLVGGASLRDFLLGRKDDPTGLYYVRCLLGANNYKSGRIARTENRWRYSAPTHEAIVHPYERPGFVTIEGCHIFHDNSKETPEGKRNAWLRDLKLLAAQVVADPKDTRSAFYLAQTYDCLRLKEEAVAAYDRRASMGGWDEEVFTALLREARFMEELKKPWLMCLGKYLDAFHAYPRRAEPLYDIALHYRKADDFHLAYVFAKRGSEIPFPKDAVLFVEEDIYNFGFTWLISTTAFYVGEMEAGADACRRIMAMYPETHARHKEAAKNLAYYVKDPVL